MSRTGFESAAVTLRLHWQPHPRSIRASFATQSVSQVCPESHAALA